MKNEKKSRKEIEMEMREGAVDNFFSMSERNQRVIVEASFRKLWRNEDMISRLGIISLVSIGINIFQFVFMVFKVL